MEGGEVGVGWGCWSGAWLRSGWWRWWFVEGCGDLLQGGGGDAGVVLEVLDGGFDEVGVVGGCGVCSKHRLVLRRVDAFVGGGSCVVAVVGEFG